MTTMTASIQRKVRESTDLAVQFFERCAPALERTVGVLAERFRRGGRLYVMGNGGSACDAQHLAVEFQHPIVEKRRALPAIALGSDAALITAIGNDTDFSRVFVGQLELIARPDDMAIGISTSGTAANVIRAVRRARELGLFTVGFSGRDGGQLADVCEVAFVVPSWSIHRIQEVHTMLLHLIWDQVQVALGEPDVL